METYLPLFKGFYGSFFESEIDFQTNQEIERINQQREGLHPISFDNLEIDYHKCNLEYCRQFTDFVESELNSNGIECKIVFQALNSPREYNFTNDSIAVSYTHLTLPTKRIV